MVRGLARRFSKAVYSAGFCKCGGTAIGASYDLISTHGRECYWVFRKDTVIGKSLRVTGEFDFFKLTAAMSKLGLKSGELLIDVGANVGSISIPAVSRKLFARAITFEPDPKNFEVLQSNIILNKLSREIEASPLALGARDAIIKLLHNYENPGASRIITEPSAPSTSHTVQVIMLDEFLMKMPSPTMIFMDVEGYEVNVLEGSKKTIELGVPVVMEFSPRQISSQSTKGELIQICGDLFTKFGFANSSRREFWSISHLARAWDELEASSIDTDLVFIPK